MRLQTIRGPLGRGTTPDAVRLRGPRLPCSHAPARAWLCQGVRWTPSHTSSHYLRPQCSAGAWSRIGVGGKGAVQWAGAWLWHTDASAQPPPHSHEGLQRQTKWELLHCVRTVAIISGQTPVNHPPDVPTQTAHRTPENLTCKHTTRLPRVFFMVANNSQRLLGSFCSFLEAF